MGPILVTLSKPNYLPNAPSPNTIALMGEGFNMWILNRGQNSALLSSYLFRLKSPVSSSSLPPVRSITSSSPFVSFDPAQGSNFLTVSLLPLCLASLPELFLPQGLGTHCHFCLGLPPIFSSWCAPALSVSTEMPPSLRGPPWLTYLKGHVCLYSYIVLSSFPNNSC